MNKLIKIQTGLITVVVFALAVTSPVLAGIGISPATLLNNRLKPGTTFRQEISISQSDPEVALDVTVEPDMEGINDWFSFEPGETFQIAEGQNNATVTLVLNIPQDAELKDYRGYIRVKATPVGSEALGGVSVVKGARLDVGLTVTETDLVELLVRSIEPKPSDRKGNIVLGLKIENRGNVAAAPSKVELAVEDLNQNPITTLTTTELAQIEVGETKEIQAIFPNDLPAGEYFANVKVVLNDTVLREEKINLKIEEGATDIPVSGEITLNIKHVVSAVVLFVSAVLVWLIARSLLKTNTQDGFAMPMPARRRLVIKLAAVVLYMGIAAVIIYLTFFYSRNGDVQGIASDSTALPVIYEADVRPPTKKFDDSLPREYRVYSEPDVSSSVIYVVQEGEQLLVLEETDGWYKVEVNGAAGWLQKADVKQVNQKVIPD